MKAPGNVAKPVNRTGRAQPGPELPGQRPKLAVHFGATMCNTCRDLLNEALNLAVRGDQFAEQERREAALAASADADGWQESGQFDRYVERNNIQNPHRRIAPRCMTMHLWVQEQYDKDLAAWQERARAHLTQGCP